jgi:hypothetical protein
MQPSGHDFYKALILLRDRIGKGLVAWRTGVAFNDGCIHEWAASSLHR